MHTFNEESAESDEFFPEFTNLQSKSVFYCLCHCLINFYTFIHLVEL